MDAGCSYRMDETTEGLEREADTWENRRREAGRYKGKYGQ